MLWGVGQGKFVQVVVQAWQHGYGQVYVSGPCMCSNGVLGLQGLLLLMGYTLCGAPDHVIVSIKDNQW